MPTMLIFFSLFLSLTAFAAPGEMPKTEPHYAFFVGSELGEREKWAVDACHFLVEIAVRFDTDSLPANCTLGVDVAKFNSEVKPSRPYVFDSSKHINIFVWEDITKVTHFYVANAQRKDETDFRHAEWTVNSQDQDAWRDAISKLAANAIFFEKNERTVKEFFLVNGILESHKIARRGDKFVNSLTGQELTLDEAYETYKNEDHARHVNYLLAGAELSLVLGGGIYWYYSNKSFNAVDWQYDIEKSIRSRLDLFDAWKFDKNGPGINKKHLNAGTAYYLIGRTNGMSRLGSFLLGFASSSFWEYAVEFREVVSINDQIVTPIGGYVMGEVLYRVGSRFVNHYADRGSRLLESLFGGGDEVNKWIARNTPKNRADVRKYGFEPQEFTYIDAGLEKQVLKDTSGNKSESVRWILNSEITDVDLMNVGGRARWLKWDPVYEKLNISGSTDSSIRDEMKLVAETAWGALYDKDLKEDEYGRLTGHNILVMPVSGLTNYQTKETKNGNADLTDMIFTVNVIGAKMNIVGRAKGLMFRMEMALKGDFAYVTSAAFKEYRKDNDVSGSVSTLKNDNYYYATGVSGVFGVSAAYSIFEIGANVNNDSYWNINARQEEAAEITKKYDIRDQRLEQELYVRLNLKKDLKLKCGLSRVVRSGSVDTFMVGDSTEIRQNCSMVYSFL